MQKNSLNNASVKLARLFKEMETLEDKQRGILIELMRFHFHNGQIKETVFKKIVGNCDLSNFVTKSDTGYYTVNLLNEINEKHLQLSEKMRLNGLKGGRPKES